LEETSTIERDKNSTRLSQMKETRIVMAPFNIYNFHVKQFRSKMTEEGETSVIFSLVLLCLCYVYEVFTALSVKGDLIVKRDLIKCQKRPI
jgi:hypothetical protein